MSLTSRGYAERPARIACLTAHPAPCTTAHLHMTRTDTRNPRTGKGAPEFDATCKDQATEIGQVVVVGTAYGTHLVRVNGRGERDG